MSKAVADDIAEEIRELRAVRRDIILSSDPYQPHPFCDGLRRCAWCNTAKADAWHLPSCEWDKVRRTAAAAPGSQPAKEPVR